MSELRNKIYRLKEKGLFHIFGTSILNKIILFLNNAVIVRVVTVEEFAAFSYANNIMSIVLLLNGLGVTAGLLQYCSENIDIKQKSKLEKYAFRVGIISNVVLTVVLFTIGMFMKLPVANSEQLLLLLALTPILSFVMELVTTKLRTNLQNKKFSYVTSINTSLVFASTLIGGLVGNISTIIMIRYISIIIPIILGTYWLKNDVAMMFKAKVLEGERKREFLKFSIVSLTNNALSQILYLVDVFLIGILIMDSKVVAIYRTATLIPFTLNFIPLSIATFIYPYFVANKDNKIWVYKKTKLLLSILGAVNLVISLILIIFAPFIIKVLFGMKYMESVTPFRILSFGYFITGTFRIPVGNILTMLKKVKYLLFVTITTGIANIIIDYLMISKFGANGAAFTVVFIYILSSALTVPYLIYNIKSKKNTKKSNVVDYS